MGTLDGRTSERMSLKWDKTVPIWEMYLKIIWRHGGEKLGWVGLFIVYSGFIVYIICIYIYITYVFFQLMYEKEMPGGLS